MNIPIDRIYFQKILETKEENILETEEENILETEDGILGLKKMKFCYFDMLSRTLESSTSRVYTITCWSI